MSKNKCLEISFNSERFILKGALHLPENDKPDIVVGSHGLESTSDSPKQIELANKCNDIGLAYFRFDHRGCGKSEGFFSKVTSIQNRKADLIKAVETVMQRSDIGSKLALFGSSMGGATCIAAAKELNAEANILVAAPVFGETLLKPPEEMEDEPGLSIEFYKKLLDFDLSGNLPFLKNTLIFHGDQDDIVPMSNGEVIYAKTNKPNKFIIQKGGDHRISSTEHQKEFLTESLNWYKKYLLK